MKLYPSTLRGTVTPPVSKSVLHRELICQALCGEFPQLRDAADDVRITVMALAALRDGDNTIDCGGSGSTLRFLLPVAAAMGKIGTVFTGSLRLLERPVPEGLPVERVREGWRISDVLHSGAYVLDGSRTSQVTSGLLMALPLVDGDSAVRVRDAVSRGYVGLTAAILRRYGIAVEETPDGYYIPSGQQYCRAPLRAETDWSAAAWFLAANRLGNEVDINSCDEDSLQPDKAILHYIDTLPDVIDMAETPDIFPVLSLLAALQPGKVTKITHCGFLRHKESDRLHNIYSMLMSLGVKAEISEDELTIHGCDGFHGNVTIDPQDDHRMAFFAAFAALHCDSPIELKKPDCIKKSYPHFWEDYITLGGQVKE